MTWITHCVSVLYNFALIWELFETVFRENTVKSDWENIIYKGSTMQLYYFLLLINAHSLQGHLYIWLHFSI